MTAVVGILNKQGVAIAADSAVTIGNGRSHKIFNKANKIFTLSKYHPVAVMIYSSANLMTTPWEIIIKEYRKYLAKKSFKLLLDYKKDFFKFLKQKKYYTTDEMQYNFLDNYIAEIVEKLFIYTANTNDELKNITIEELKTKLPSYLNTVIDVETQFLEAQEKNLIEFQDYTFEDFKSFSNSIFQRIFDHIINQEKYVLEKEQIESIKKLIYLYIIKPQARLINLNYTGLVFTGYGENEIYPQINSVNIFTVINGRLRYYDEENNSSISDQNPGSICPFAQTDVMNTILQGIAPFLEETYKRNFFQIFHDYNTNVILPLVRENTDLVRRINALDLNILSSLFVDMNEKVKAQNFIIPLLQAVSTLSKDDLAEMAESLIYLTYLKRRMTNEEESVGGPVDVAIISKGDGLVWIKRKHYFRPELNQHFFDNYFNK